MIIQRDLTGKIINSFSTKVAAARSLGLDESSIRKAIKHDRVVLGKFLFSQKDEFTETEDVPEKSKAKILIVDIETAPIKAYVWSLWKQNVYLDQIICDWFMLSWSAKWLDEDEVLSAVLTPSEVKNEDDYNIIIPLWDLFDEADIVIAHNGDSFDIPKINSRFLINGLMPPSPYKQIDTKKVASNVLGESSNKLEALARRFGLEGKFDTDFVLWADCMNGDQEALLRMALYNNQDVVVLEKVYLKLRPYIKGHPNLDLYADSEFPSCPHCGSNFIKLVPDKFFYTQAVRYELYECKSCGAKSRSKKGFAYKNKRQISAIPR